MSIATSVQIGTKPSEITLSDAAIAKVSELLAEEQGAEALALRVAVRPGGCSGFSYDMFFDSEIASDDIVRTFGDVKVVVDPESVEPHQWCDLGLQGRVERRWVPHHELEQLHAPAAAALRSADRFPFSHRASDASPHSGFSVCCHRSLLDAGRGARLQVCNRCRRSALSCCARLAAAPPDQRRRPVRRPRPARLGHGRLRDPDRLGCERRPRSSGVQPDRLHVALGGRTQGANGEFVGHLSRCVIAIAEKGQKSRLRRELRHQYRDTGRTCVTGRAGKAIAAGNGPAGIAITPNGEMAYVSDAGTAPIGNTVTPINLVTKKPLPPITVGDGPQGIAIPPDGKTAYVADAGAIVSGQSGPVGKTVTPSNLATGRALPPIPVGNGPLWHRRGDHTGWVNRVRHELLLGQRHPDQSTGDQHSRRPGLQPPGSPQAIAITPDGSTGLG